MLGEQLWFVADLFWACCKLLICCMTCTLDSGHVIDVIMSPFPGLVSTPTENPVDEEIRCLQWLTPSCVGNAVHTQQTSPTYSWRFVSGSCGPTCRTELDPV